MGGEGKDVGLRENGGEALQRQAGSTRSPRCSLMLSRGWRQGSSSGESGRGKCFSSHFGVRAFPWIAGVPLKPCTSPLRTWVRSEGSWSPMLAAFGQALGTSAAWPLPHTEGTRAGAAGRAARKRGAQPAPWGASSACPPTPKPGAVAGDTSWGSGTGRSPWELPVPEEARLCFEAGSFPKEGSARLHRGVCGRRDLATVCGAPSIAAGSTATCRQVRGSRWNLRLWAL